MDVATQASINENEKNLYTLTHKARYDNFTLDSYYQDETTKKFIVVPLLTKKNEELKVFNTQGSFFLGNHALTVGGQYQKEKSLIPQMV